MIVEIDKLSRRDASERYRVLHRHNGRQRVVRGVEDVQFAAEIIEGRGFCRISHNRHIAEWLAVVTDGAPFAVFVGTPWPVSGSLGGVGLLPGHDSPASGDFDVG